MKVLILVMNVFAAIFKHCWRSERGNNKSGLSTIFTIVLLLFTSLSESQEKTQDNEQQAIQVGSRKVSAKISGDEPGVCHKFIKEYDFGNKTLKNPLEWTKVPEDKLADPVNYYGWIYQMDLDVDNDSVKERLYKTILSIHGVNAAKEIEVLSLDSKINTDKLDLFEVSKNALRFVKGDAVKEMRSHGISSIYSYDVMNSVQPFLMEGSVYIYLSNERDPVDDRFYLIIQLQRVSGIIANKEICRIAFN